MDGNGRWARARNLPNTEGHKAGIQPLREVIQSCGELNIPVLTVFAFSSENWQRPEEEVSTLMSLFIESLTNEIDELHEKSVQLRVIGGRDKFSEQLRERMEYCEHLTQDNTRLVLTIAVDYGGRWDIVQSAKKMASSLLAGEINIADIDESIFAKGISNSDLPDPDLCIRTGGDYRISNFLLWQFAYTEIIVNPCLWPEYNSERFREDLSTYAERERRFGKSGV